MSGVSKIAENIDVTAIENLVGLMHEQLQLRDGKLFILGCGGSASNSSHAVNDFRKLCNIQAYAPFDNMSEMTARINDDGWDNSLVGWLKGNKLNHQDIVFILSVGGGDEKNNISVNLIRSVQYAHKQSAYVASIVGREKSYVAENSSVCVVIPNMAFSISTSFHSKKELATPYTESFQSVILHLIASHPLLRQNKTKWESVND